MIFSDGIPSRIKMYNFNKALKNGKAKHLLLPGTMSKQLLQYLDVNLKMYTHETVLIHAGINDVLNDKSQLNTENLLCNIKYMSQIWYEKYINIWFGFHHNSIFRSVGKNHEKLSTFCLVMV